MNTKGMQKKRIDLRIEEDLRDLADRVAKTRGLNLSAYIRLALTERLDRDLELQPLARPNGGQRPQKKKK